MCDRSSAERLGPGHMCNSFAGTMARLSVGSVRKVFDRINVFGVGHTTKKFFFRPTSDLVPVVVLSSLFVLCVIILCFTVILLTRA